MHGHLCPICKTAFNCMGLKCGHLNGVPHLRCAPTHKIAKWTDEVVYLPQKGYVRCSNPH
jgi:hypothetical protein